MAYLIILFIVLIITAIMITPKGKVILDWLKFYISGKDSGFSFREIGLLWTVSEAAELKNPSSLFWSLQTFDKCTAAILKKLEVNGSLNSVKNQDFLSRLYSYRTKIEFDSPKYKKGIKSSREMSVGQPVCILLKGVGVYNSRLAQNNSTGLFLDYPVPVSAKVASPDWIDKEVSVYFWRRDDAGYVFDTRITDQAFVNSKPSLCAVHSMNLLRSQKRRSIRAQCSIPATLYVLTAGMENSGGIPPNGGIKCLLEDISEDGAAILVGGKGAKGLRVKVQFELGENTLLMSGEIKGVDVIENKNQSCLHFECLELTPWMKNQILSFVYNVMPEGEREVFDAIRISEEQGTGVASVVPNASGTILSSTNSSLGVTSSSEISSNSEGLNENKQISDPASTESIVSDESLTNKEDSSFVSSSDEKDAM